MHGASHYQWQGQALYTVNGPAVQGKLNTALNSYCISILGNWNACGSCHVGLGAKPEATATSSQLQNIDCLICHQKDYKRKKDTTGVFVPDTVNMSVTMDQAVQTVHKPVRANCVQCHAKGGGGDNNKRGDMALAHATTTDRDFDVHMSSTGANLTCQQCHTTQNHRIAGRGSDLRQTDLDVQVNCSTATCHTNKMTSAGHATADINHHVNRVACQTCHIKTFSRNAADTTANESTEVYRDWTTPEWVSALNRWEPLITRGSDQKPLYTFWNGTSWNYSLKETVRFEAATGTYPTSRPEGDINNTGSMLYPFKYKKALQPIADSLGMLVALDTSVYFASGNYDNAVKAGLANMGYPSTTLYRNVDTDTYQLITHEVMPKGNALTCTQCHSSTATQMNLKGMGYAMKGTQSTTCTQCHGNEDMPSYTSLHNKHVTDKKYDCSWCHSFSRPERSLKMPSGQTGSDTTAPSISVFAIPTTASTLTVSITTLSATDNVAVAGYLLTETATKPSATASGWTSAKPASYAFASAGAKTLYAWARDAAGNISASRSANVTITISSGTADISTANSLDLGSAIVNNSVNKTLKVTNKGTAKLSVTKIEVVGADASAFKPSATSFSVDPSQEYPLGITFRPTSQRTYVATLNIYSNDPDTPAVGIALSGSGTKRGRWTRR
jgi:nitrate reductase cytochrome c-type subunit